MRRLIEADNLKQHIIETYHDPIIVCNDDEVHFVAEIIDEYPTVEAIPKDQYEARLKADMVAMLTELQVEIKEMDSGCGWDGYRKTDEVIGTIQQKIDKLKESE